MLAKGNVGSRIINRFWVCNTVVPQDPVTTLGIDLSRPIIYVLSQNSSSDLLALQKACQQAALPDPYQTIPIAESALSAVIFLHEQYWFKTESLQQQQAAYIKQYSQLSSLLEKDSELEVQLVPVTLLWGRAPSKHKTARKHNINHLHKTCLVLCKGQDLLMRFNPPISARNLLNPHQKDKTKLAYQLAKITLQYFTRQYAYSSGPPVLARQKAVKQLLASEQLQQDIKQHSIKTGLPEKLVTQQCQVYLQEISSRYSYRFLRVFRTILSRVWNGIYQGIAVNNAQAVRDVIESGAEVVYMPCHRSHMDYLLLSYLLYEQGLMPPHIAAGVNLNFFPAGGIFRRSGAFFIRRSFKGDPLYSKVFKAYFSMLYEQGYPIEFFTEGGRSRTGRLLPPKTGLLAMSVDTFLTQVKRNVVIVPIYIGYDHIMEVSTYMKELSGKQKRQENAWQMLGILKKLGHFGRAFVNFGAPISLTQYFDQQSPQWRSNKLSGSEIVEQVNHLATKVMQGINQATAVNPLPLCAALVLASTDHQLGKQRLFALITLHQQLLGLLSVNSLMTYPTQAPEVVYEEALAINKFFEINDVISADRDQSIQLTYYRNTIVHLFALPAILSFCLIQLYYNAKNTRGLDRIPQSAIERLMARLLPFVQVEYFLVPSTQPLTEQVRLLLLDLQAVNIIRVDGDFIEIIDLSLIKVLSAHLSETRLRYYCVLSILIANFKQSDAALIAESKVLLTAHSIEPFDLKVIEVFIKQLDRSTLTLEVAEQLLNCLSEQ